jgi:hypothetical protein
VSIESNSEEKEGTWAWGYRSVGEHFAQGPEFILAPQKGREGRMRKEGGREREREEKGGGRRRKEEEEEEEGRRRRKKREGRDEEEGREVERKNVTWLNTKCRTTI